MSSLPPETLTWARSRKRRRRDIAVSMRPPLRVAQAAVSDPTDSQHSSHALSLVRGPQAEADGHPVWCAQ